MRGCKVGGGLRASKLASEQSSNAKIGVKARYSYKREEQGYSWENFLSSQPPSPRFTSLPLEKTVSAEDEEDSRMALAFLTVTGSDSL